MSKGIGSFLLFKNMLLLLENISHDDLKKYMKEFYSYAAKELNLDRPPKIVFKKDQSNADDLLGKTGFYDPDTEQVALFIVDRHAKDILRSFAHELVHHQQKCRGADKDIDMSITASDPSYASHDPKLREMEREAFERGNMLFRDWCDMKKMERGNLMENKKLKKGKHEMEEAAKPDFLDLDGDGNTKETMKKASADAKKGKTKGIKKQAKKEAKEFAKHSRGEDIEENDTFGDEAVEALEENYSHPYPQLFKKKERLNNERQTQYEQWIYEEMLKRAIK